MRYHEPLYRPPSEANSLLIQATIGCPHNRCTFCGMYKGIRFRIRQVQEIKEDLEMARQYYGEGVRTLFFPDGNTICMKTDQLVEIFGYARALFPRLERITVYGSARFLLLKSPAELRALHEAGLKRIHAGMESGDDETLRRIRKGATSDGMIEAGRRVKEAGIELSEYILVGIGGRDRWQEHALNSARALNAINPHFIRLRTLVPVPNAPLYQDYLRGDFQLPSPHEALREIRLLVEELDVSSLLVSDHVSNYLNIQGTLPAEKQRILDDIDAGLATDEGSFVRYLLRL